MKDVGRERIVRRDVLSKDRQEDPEQKHADSDQEARRAQGEPEALHPGLPAQERGAFLPAQCDRGAHSRPASRIRGLRSE